MQQHFTQEIESLRTNIIKMASIVDEMFERAISSAEIGTPEISKLLKAKDLEVDAYDNLIQTQCENILAIFQPFASDLRFMISAMMINNQLERCGDITVNIARRLKKIGVNNNLVSESKILEMAAKAKGMLVLAIDSFIHSNSAIAYEVLEKDVEVDKFNKSIFKYSTEKMKTDTDLIIPGTHLVVLARQIERLADHTTNIAENVIFSLEARLMTHTRRIKKKDLE
ncbi:MAG: phosphate signaling complex protein PhoU [Melioribacteraceae bacterium]|jgi:phosphate transport system protein|nr:phosphate signaling complex protein PhoU [Melioribacteraceae bacterium]